MGTLTSLQLHSSIRSQLYCTLFSFYHTQHELYQHFVLQYHFCSFGLDEPAFASHLHQYDPVAGHG